MKWKSRGQYTNSFSMRTGRRSWASSSGPSLFEAGAAGAGRSVAMSSMAFLVGGRWVEGRGSTRDGDGRAEEIRCSDRGDRVPLWGATRGEGSGGAAGSVRLLANLKIDEADRDGQPRGRGARKQGGARCGAAPLRTMHAGRERAQVDPRARDQILLAPLRWCRPGTPPWAIATPARSGRTSRSS